MEEFKYKYERIFAFVGFIGIVLVIFFVIFHKGCWKQDTTTKVVTKETIQIITDTIVKEKFVSFLW